MDLWWRLESEIYQGANGQRRLLPHRFAQRHPRWSLTTTHGIVAKNWGSRTGTLPNGAPIGGLFSDLIQRNPVTGAVLSVDTRIQNLDVFRTEGLDYAASYQLDTSIFDHGNFGTLTFNFNGNYLDRFVAKVSHNGIYG